MTFFLMDILPFGYLVPSGRVGSGRVGSGRVGYGRVGFGSVLFCYILFCSDLAVPICISSVQYRYLVHRDHGEVEERPLILGLDLQ
jgi:hypothetical protein